MRSKQYIFRLLILSVLAVILLAVASCQQAERIDKATATLEAELVITVEPQPSPVATEPVTEEPTQQPTPTVVSTSPPAPTVMLPEMGEFVSATEMFSATFPVGWSVEEVVPGADIVIANSQAALARYEGNNGVQEGDIVLNIGFLPYALLQDNRLAHLGFQFEASPDVFLESLLPLFRVGDQSADGASGEVTLISLSDERDAGMLTFSEGKREGMMLVFVAGDGIVAFVSAAGSSGTAVELQGIANAIAADLTYSGTQDALYGALFGG